MSKMIRVTDGEKYIGRLSKGADLLEEMTGRCMELGIRFSRIEAIGAVSRARLAYYDQKEREYCHFDINEPLEIASLIGNISLKDGQPMVHAHVTLADESGKTYGGHLAPGTIVFACEIVIQAFKEEPLKRGKDEETGLPLWEDEGLTSPLG